MVYPRPSFGGRPPRSSQYNPHPCADGPAFSQQAGFLRPYSTNGSGPRNNGESWNTWHNPNRSNRSNNNNNHHDGRRDFENLHRVRRDSFVQTHSGNEYHRPGNNFNGRAANSSHPRVPRPNQSQSQGQHHNHPSSHEFHQSQGQAYRPPSQPYHQNQNPPSYESNRGQGQGRRRRGGRNRRKPPFQQPHSPQFNHAGRSASIASMASMASIASFEAPQETPMVDGLDGADLDGDVEMLDAPPLDIDLVQVLTEGTVAMHNIAQTMLQHATAHG